MFGFALLAQLFTPSILTEAADDRSDLTARLMDRAERIERFNPAEARELRGAAQAWLTVATSR